MGAIDLANQIKNDGKSISLIYAFNAVGKTTLSVAYKDVTKDADGKHTGIYFNAFSEDLFVWDNDTANGEINKRLTVKWCQLSKLHASLDELKIHAKLKPYRPPYDFRFVWHGDIEEGIDYIKFFIPSEAEEEKGKEPAIKISRGEERIFVWCFFLALLDVEGWADIQAGHIFIDDPVSSLDDHNIFVTASTIFDLIETYHANRKIVLTTHHIGLFSVLYDWLYKGEKSGKYKPKTTAYLLSRKSGAVTLETEKNDVFLYHLRILQLLNEALGTDAVRSHHFVLLRQLLENIASFHGVGRVSFVLEQIGIEDPNEIARIVNVLSHKNVYYYESDELVPDTRKIFDSIFEKLMTKHKFVLHA